MQNSINSHSITALQEVEMLITLSMHYNSIADIYPVPRKGMHSFFPLRCERFSHLIKADALEEFENILYGWGEPAHALAFAAKNLAFTEEGRSEEELDTLIRIGGDQ